MFKDYIVRGPFEWVIVLTPKRTLNIWAVLRIIVFCLFPFLLSLDSFVLHYWYGEFLVSTYSTCRQIATIIINIY